MVRVYNNPQRSLWRELQERASFDDTIILERVKVILERIKNGGDAALREVVKEIDGWEASSFLYSVDFMAEGESSAKECACSSKFVELGVSVELQEAINTAYSNITKFHTLQESRVIDIETTPGVRCIQKPIPIERVGLYIPGGSAPLFSTVLMLGVPAQVAKCKEVVLSTPVNKEGVIAPEILYAASLCGIKEIYGIGGAQAIAAMAYGTESIKPVDKIFGPGNRYVTKAKQIVAQERVAIDMPAGPSEVMILADSSSNPAFVVADMLSQAEHGGDSQAILVTNCAELVDKVQKEITAQLELLSRSGITAKALDNSKIIVLESMQEVIDFANEYASEHLIVSTSEPWSVVNEISCAGSIFVGYYTPESAGDYASGTNHTLPTNGWARSYSGVNLDAFVKKVTIQEISAQGLVNLGGTIVKMADAEGLDAHANAVKIRLKELNNER